MERGSAGAARRAACAWFLACFGSLALAGCASETALGPALPKAAAPAIPSEAFVGRWGVAAFHQDKDRARTEKEARAQCSNPYVIAKGPTDGFMMHLADEKEPNELIVKSGGGKNYIGPEGPPGDVFDREIVSYDPNMFVVSFVDPEVAARYGTMVYVRCGAAAGPTAKPAAKPARTT